MAENHRNVQAIVIEHLEVSAYEIPTDSPESDGTLTWDSTTLVLVTVRAGGKKGIGYTYAGKPAAVLISRKLGAIVTGSDALDIPAIREAMIRSIRNEGSCGIAYMAVSAVDNALWDLKARLFDLPLARLIGMCLEGMPVYGSGGFTSYSLARIQDQLGGWVDEGINRVKMKVGRNPGKDLERVKAAREAIGEDAELFVDANGAYSTSQALEEAAGFAQYGVTWFEEPVPSANLAGLNFIRQKKPPSMDIAAGEYGYEPDYFRHMLESGAVDVLQADATRCGGITGFLEAGTICQSFHLPFSAHCAPSIHLHAAPSLAAFRHAEYFHDHVRIEHLLFDGVQKPVNGVMKPDPDRPGFGLELRQKDAEKYEI